jgi:hypothetical protein
MTELFSSDKTEGLAPLPVLPPTTVVTYGKKVLVCLPWQKHVSPITAMCVTNLVDRKRTATMLNFGDAFVAHSRNSCADHFLKGDFEWMLTIDDDMIIPFGNAQWFNAFTGMNLPEKFAGLNALDRLMSHKKSLVGALYFGRHAFGPAVYNEGTANPQEADYARSGPHDLVKPTKWVGTGCMLIHRSVFEDIEKKFPLLARGADGNGGQWFTSTEVSFMQDVIHAREALDGPLTGEKAYKALTLLDAAISKAKVENTLGCGEDVSFCRRAAASGHQPYVDMGLICGHLGHKVYGPSNTGNKPALSR